MPARRRRRRARRRDQACSRAYSPMVVDSEVARRGVRVRLAGALGAVLLTVGCAIYAIMTAMSSFGATFAVTVGLCSFGAAVGLLLSARQEEKVHAFAARMGRSAALESSQGATMRALIEDDGIYPLLAGEDRRARARVYSKGQERLHPPAHRAGPFEGRRRSGSDHTDGAI